MADWIAAATACSNHGVPMIPFSIYYSMFGFQRIGDPTWAAGDSRARGFMLGGTARRTTLNGEGLQHEDGIIRSLYRLKEVRKPGKKHVNLLGSGTILIQAMKAAEMLEVDFGVTADIWSATILDELARDGQDAARWNRLNPLAE